MATIDTSLNLNQIPWTRSDFRLPGYSFSRSGDGKVYTEAFRNPLWNAELFSSNMSKLAKPISYQRWVAILQRLRNEAIGFPLYDVEHQAPSLPFAATGLTINAINSDRSGFTLSGTNLTSADRLGAGDFIEITVDASTGERYLFINRTDWTYSTTNEITVTPALNTAISDGDAVVVEKPRGNFQIESMATSAGANVNEGRISLTLIGAL